MAMINNKFATHFKRGTFYSGTLTIDIPTKMVTFWTGHIQFS